MESSKEPQRVGHTARRFLRGLGLSIGLLIGLALAGSVWWLSRFLSTPRDFASPPATIRVLDWDGAPMSGIQVRRSWYDSDSGKSGEDLAVTDETGTSRFAKVPARIWWFTGVLRKAVMGLGPCGSGSGTETTVYVRYTGLYEVAPQGKSLHQVGPAYEDPDGVWLDPDTDRQSNTEIRLMFPKGAKVIGYTLISTPRSR